MGDNYCCSFFLLINVIIFVLSCCYSDTTVCIC